jgi:methyl-accepting chemotaxis protein
MAASSNQPSVAIDLAGRLKNWSIRNEVQTDPYVRAIVDALENGNNLSFWSGKDPYQFLPEASSQSVSRVLWIARSISIIRNVLIFAPVAITWLAISQATAAFNLYIQDNSGLPVNFLQFWQDGYGYLDSHWRLSEVAQLAFLIIAFIAFLSVLIGGGQTFGLSRAERIERVSDLERKQLAFELSIYFQQFKEVPREITEDELRKTTSLIVKANSEALSSMGKLQQIIDQLSQASSAAAAGLDATSSQLNEVAGGLSVNFDSQQAKFVALGEAIETLIAALKTVPESATQESKQVAKLIDALSNVVNGQLTDVVNSATRQLDSANEEIALSSSSLKKSARSTQDQLEDLQRQIARSLKDLKG